MGLRQMVDNLLMYDSGFAKFAGGFTSKMGGSSATYPVSSLAEFSDVVNNFGSIKYLELLFHGSPGTLHLPDETVMEGTYLVKLGREPLFFQRDVRILLDACNFGEGSRGDQVMDYIGLHGLKGKGGTIGASTVVNIGVLSAGLVFMNPFKDWWFADGRLKVRRYDTSGKLVGSRSVDKNGIPD